MEKGITNLLCVRLDNMGDVLMSTPAIRALKETFGCRITLLTSTIAAPICEFIPLLDEVLLFDAPWVKSDEDTTAIASCVDQLKSRQFDAAVIFTVFSQNPLPTAMLLYMAGIPRRIAYCRENPYRLLTDWIPDEEPYSLIRHQVERDLFLAKKLGAVTEHTSLNLEIPELHDQVFDKLKHLGVNVDKAWLVMHPCVSEQKREYAVENWVAIGRGLTEFGCQLILTGPAGRDGYLKEITRGIGQNAFSAGGCFDVGEMIVLISHAPLIISVNTLIPHIAAAVQTEVIVLYAETNPQHTPWNGISKIFTFPVAADMQSHNEVLRYVKKIFSIEGSMHASPVDVVKAAMNILQ